MRVRGRHYETARDVDLVLEAGAIREVGPANPARADVEAGWVAPALFDLQINGCDGHSFNSPRLTHEGIVHVVRVCQAHGIAALCPTLVTGSFEALNHGLTTLRRACERDAVLARAMPGFHVEGPYISPEDGPRGAHPRKHVRPPSWDEFRQFQDAAGGRIRLLTLAPEIEGAVPFIEKVVASGVVVALGHTAASKEKIQAAVKAGARLSTHLGNGSHAMLPRHDNYLWEQLAEDGLMASIICDGHHLPPQLVKCFVRIKTPGRLILTCDSGSLAGLPPGRYQDWDQEFDILPEGKIVLAGTPYLAGSWAFTDLCLANVLRFSDVALADAVNMASNNPRNLLGFEENRLGVGSPADLVLFDFDPQGGFRLRQTIVEGRLVERM